MTRQKHKKSICAELSKDPFYYILEALKPKLAQVVSGHWSGQRGEFLVLHHSDSCVQLHYARAAGSPSCWGRSWDGLASLAQGLRPRFMGQALAGHRTDSRSLGGGGQ